MRNDRPVRKRNRLTDFDYSYVGEYFITICTKDKQNFFWKSNTEGLAESKNYKEFLTELGKAVDCEITNIAAIYPDRVCVDKYVIMPDHVHLLIVILGTMPNDITQSPSVPQIVNQFKRAVTIKTQVRGIWQKGYYDHIIRGEKDYNETWDYIDANPRKLTGNMFME